MSCSRFLNFFFLSSRCSFLLFLFSTFFYFSPCWNSLSHYFPSPLCPLPHYSLAPIISYCSSSFCYFISLFNKRNNFMEKWTGKRNNNLKRDVLVWLLLSVRGDRGRGTGWTGKTVGGKNISLFIRRHIILGCVL